MGESDGGRGLKSTEEEMEGGRSGGRKEGRMRKDGGREGKYGERKGESDRGWE